MKHYIVANKEQELDVLKKLEEKGLNWSGGNTKPTEWLPSEDGFEDDDKFPYILHEREYLLWGHIKELEDEIIVYDGRKELEKMTEVKKYKVTKEFMDKLVEWRGTRTLDTTTGDFLSHVAPKDLDSLPSEVETWWYSVGNSMERNRRLIAIISWLNGEDVFEVEKPRKYIVRSDSSDREGGYWYVSVREGTAGSPSYPANGLAELTYIRDYATEFDTCEEAKEWTNSHQVVVEIDEYGKEV